AIGYHALITNLSSDNTAVGSLAANFTSTGSSNTALGTAALYANTAGSSNTGVGAYALDQNSSGTGNSALGVSAGPNAATRSNTTALGYLASCTAGNQVRVGNSSVSTIVGAVAFAPASDARFKQNIQEDVHGIDLIMKLRPVTYTFNAHQMAAFLKEDVRYDENGNAVLQTPHPDMIAARDQKAAIRFTGFLAQEVEKAADELGYDFSAVVKPVDENDMYALRYSEFVVPLVKGMQEQQAMIESQQAVIEQLQERIQRLEQGR
ncbi:MAG: tail fiber domain-containing protein, partial [Flavobacteriales bacterium]